MSNDLKNDLNFTIKRNPQPAAQPAAQNPQPAAAQPQSKPEAEKKPKIEPKKKKGRGKLIAAIVVAAVAGATALTNYFTVGQDFPSAPKSLDDFREKYVLTDPVYKQHQDRKGPNADIAYAQQNMRQLKDASGEPIYSGPIDGKITPEFMDARKNLQKLVAKDMNDGSRQSRLSNGKWFVPTFGAWQMDYLIPFTKSEIEATTGGKDPKPSRDAQYISSSARYLVMRQDPKYTMN